MPFHFIVFPWATRTIASARLLKEGSPRIGVVSSGLGGLEQLHDPLCQANQLIQRWNDWLSWEKRGFVERYLSGQTKLGLRRIDVGPPYDGAILEAWPLRGHLKSLGTRSGRDKDGGGH